jgi:hypothetical protein
MFKCEWCNKEVKSSSGLKRHMNSCSQKPIESQEDVEVANESHEVVKVSTDNSMAIEKLLDLRKSTFDAEARYRIDLQIKELNSES